MQYATAKALLLRDLAGKEHLGPDPLYTFRCQRMLQRADMALWEQTAQLEQPGDRLELAFATLYPDKVPQGWQKPVLIESSGPKVGQAALKGQAAKPAATPATSSAQEDEAGIDLPLIQLS